MTKAIQKELLDKARYDIMKAERSYAQTHANYKHEAFEQLQSAHAAFKALLAIETID